MRLIMLTIFEITSIMPFAPLKHNKILLKNQSKGSVMKMQQLEHSNRETIQSYDNLTLIAIVSPHRPGYQ